MSYNPEILNLNNYRVEKMPVRSRNKFEKWLQIIGIPLAIITYFLFFFVIDFSFLTQINPETLSKDASEIYKKIGAIQFSYTNKAMFAIFVTSLILWVTEAIPNYLTSLIVIVTMVLTGILSEKAAYAQLGHPVMWLNILSFVLASMLVSTGAAKRFALWFLIKFGKNVIYWLVFNYSARSNLFLLFRNYTKRRFLILYNTIDKVTTHVN